MSSQRGNISRTRPQKHKNVTAFKNNLNDSSKKTKSLNALVFNNVCSKCKAILEWKVKYKKYKPIKSAKTCVKCNEKTVKEAYHTICETCAKSNSVCPKCGSHHIENSKDAESARASASVTDKFNKLVLEKSKVKNKKTDESGEEESEESYDIESSSDYERDSESLISSDCDNPTVNPTSK